LFREKDIRSPKSVTAANAALAMNPALHITSNMDKVCADTEKVYTDEFIKSNDMLVNALDNVQVSYFI
jgi:molybdopterin/thiamine biosynthesis adenylyltransferase